MASRISQMRNGTQPYPQTLQAQLNQSVLAVRDLMRQVQTASDPQAMLAQILQNNPNTAAIATLLKNNNNSLESIARQMAQERGIDINQLLAQLQGGN